METPSAPLEKLVVIEGRNSVYSKILQMIEELRGEILMVTTNRGVVRVEQAGIFDAVLDKAETVDAKEKAASNPRARILTQFSRENLKTIKEINEKALETPIKIELRHLNAVLGSAPDLW